VEHVDDLLRHIHQRNAQHRGQQQHSLAGGSRTEHGTDIDLTDSLVDTLPKHPTPNRLFWGQDFHSSSLPGRNATWGEEAYVDAQFQKMTNKFISQGIPVMIGEFGPMKRTTANFPDLTGENVSLHLASRTYFNTSAPSMLPAKAAIPQKSRARPRRLRGATGLCQRGQ
jgi:hypothetical protein